MKLLEDISFLDGVFEQFIEQNTLTNNYMLKDEYLKHIENRNIYFDIDERNIFFYLKKSRFYRLYYFINESGKPYSFDYQIPIILEILYRGAQSFPKIHHDYWLQSGFKTHISRDCYFLKNTDLDEYSIQTTVNIKKAVSETEIFYIKKLIDENLDLYTGDILSLSEIRQFANTGLVYISYWMGEPCGVLQADIKNNIFWLGHIVVDVPYRGKGISKDLVAYYLNEGIQASCKQFQLWVIQDNLTAVSLYKKYGFKYLNKSSLSMLKK
jgi:GNAT superfamily N-acetyltransferase